MSQILANHHKERRERLKRLGALPPVARRQVIVRPIVATPKPKKPTPVEAVVPIRKPTVEAVKQVVGKYYRVSVKGLDSRERLIRYVGPRQVAMYLAWELTDASSTEVGKKFGKRDHSTVVYSAGVVAWRLGDHSRKPKGVENPTNEVDLKLWIEIEQFRYFFDQ